MNAVPTHGRQGPAQRAASIAAIARLDKGGFVFHKERHASYASGCNGEAIRDAGRNPRLIGIDLDINPNSQGTPFCHHQLHPTKRDAWFDPQHQITDADSCRHLTDAQMRRLRVRFQGANRPILTAHKAARICDNHGLLPCFEAKFASPLYLEPDWWYEQFVKGWKPRLQPVIMTLPGTNGGRTGLRKLAAAHEVGLPTMWLWRGNTPITRTKGFKDAVDLVKSRPGHGIYQV